MPKTAAAVEPKEMNYDAKLFRVDEIHPRPTNRKIEPASVDELAKQIEAEGLQTPITIRETPADAWRVGDATKYQIIAGERRWLAFKRLKREYIPAFRRDMDDIEAEEYALTENLQRQDLHPMQEAEAYEIILRHQDMTIPLLAPRIGKEVSYIRKRLELLKLIKPFRNMFIKGAIGVEQAKELCRIPPDAQKAYLGWVGPEAALEDHRGLPSAPKIAEWIQKNIMLNLRNAPFPLNASELVAKAGACINCPKRTGHDTVLFDDVKKDDFCLDGDCYNGKIDKLIQITLKADTKPMLVATSYVDPHSIKDLPKGTLLQGQYTLITKQSEQCDHITTGAMVVFGLDRGHRVTICRDQSCKEHAGRHREQHMTAETPQEREKRLRADRAEKAKKETRRQVLKAIGDKVDELKHPELEALAIAMFCRLWNVLQHKVLRLLDWNQEKKRGGLDDIFKAEIAKVKGQRLNQILVILALASHMDGNSFNSKQDVLMDFATRYKINIDKIKAEVGERYKPKK